MSADRIADVIRDVLHAAPADHGFPPDRDDECRFCGRTDGDLVLLQHDSGTDTAIGHVECGDPERFRIVPACDGAADLCGAPAGTACEPGCPSLAADRQVTP